MKFEINTGEKALEVEFEKQGDKLLIRHADTGLYFEAVKVQSRVYSVIMNNRSYVVGVCPTIEQRVNVNGTPILVELLDSIHLHLRDLGWNSVQEAKVGLVVAQIPGLVTKIFHKLGDTVEEGEPLFLMEAMKMENEIKAPVAGTIQKISIREGETVDKGTNIIEIG